MFFSEQFTLESDSPRKSMLKQGQSAARKRPFNVVNSFLTEGQKDDLDDGNILSSLGMNKEQDIFKSPQSDAFFKKFSEPEPIEKPTKTPSKKTVVGQSPYFCSSTPTKQDEEVNPKADLSDIDKEISEDMAKQKSQVPPKATKIPKEKTPSTKEQKLEVSAIKPRQARPIGEFSVSSLEKELQEIMQYLKEEREKDQELFVECSKSLRQKVNVYWSFSLDW